MTKEVQKWADSAMFESEEMPFDVNRDGPQVHLLHMSSDPLGQIAAACKMYKGEVVRSLGDVTDDERRQYLEQIQKTKLKAPFEFVKFHFMIEGVTRSFTHQMVRQRTAVYAQESLRFAVKENMDEEVMLPPSLAGLPADDPKRVLWQQAINSVDDRYNALVASGVPAEDARGLLPHNITTRLHYSTDLRALQDHAGNRLCTQAQFEWRLVWVRIVEAIRTYEEAAWWPTTIGEVRWQYEALADIFRPVCYLTGKCEFKANFDRSCSIRDRVDGNEKAGRPSSEWEQDFTAADAGSYIHGVDDPRENTVYVGAIRPAEWLLDPTAARKEG